jgi:hypothetical protein
MHLVITCRFTQERTRPTSIRVRVLPSPAVVPLVLLTVAAPIGAFDSLYYHLWRFRLYTRAESRRETVTHVVRALVIGIGALLLAHSKPSAPWFAVLSAVLSLSFVNDVADVLLEPASRRALGGVPPIEYLVHILGATLSGAVATAFMLRGLEVRGGGEVAGLPAWLVASGTAIAVGAVALAVFEGALLCNSTAKAWGTD